jgi:HEAT repeat protein
MVFRPVLVLLLAAAACLPCSAAPSRETEEKIDRLLPELESEDEATRRNAAQELQRCGSNNEVIVNEFLRHVETHPDPVVRGLGLEVLLWVRDRDFTELFGRVLKNDKAVFPRVMAATGLAKAGDREACNVLLEGLEDKSKYVQQRAVRALVYGIPEGAQKRLIQIVKDQRPVHLVIDAVTVLGRNKVTQADQVIVDFARSLSRQSFASLTCISALRHLGTKAAQEYLIERAANLGGEPHVQDLVNSLGDMKDNPKAFEILKMLARFGTDDQARIAAVESLGSVGTPEAFDVVMEVSEADWKHAQRTSMTALCKFEDQKATRAILKMAENTKDSRALETGLKELVKRKETRAIELCLRLMSEKEGVDLPRGFGNITVPVHGSSWKLLAETATAFKEPSVIPHLIEAAMGTEASYHTQVFEALRVFENDQLIPRYVEQVKKPTQYTDFKRSICKELIRLKAPGLVKLIGEQLVDEVDPDMRSHYALSLVAIGDKAAAPYIVKAFKNEGMVTGYGLTEALGKLRIEEGVELIKGRLDMGWPNDWFLRAYRALGEIGTKEAMQLVYEGLEKNLKTGIHPAIKGAMVESIAKSGDAEHVNKLLEVLKYKPDAKVKIIIIKGFARVKDKAIEPFLKECVEGVHGDDAAREALLAQAQLSGDPQKYLRGKLSDADKKLRRHAALLLLDMKDGESLARICKLTEDADTNFAYSMAFEVCHRGVAGAADAVRKLIERYPAGERRYRLREELARLEQQALRK